MKFNPDCARDVLIALESCGPREIITVEKLCERIPGQSADDVHYSCKKLNEAGFIEAETADFLAGGTSIIAVKDITYAGHEFLTNIRKDAIWDGVKSVAKKVGATSISAMTQIATNVVTELIKAHFGLI